MIDSLLKRVKEVEDEALADAGPRDRAEERVLLHARTRALPARGVDRSRWFGWGALAAAAIVLAALLGRELARPPVAVAPLRYELSGGRPSVGGFIAAPEPASLRFSEGTEVHLARGTRARVTALRATGADILIEAGGLSARVVHQDETDWRFHAGPFAVVVIGTAFDAVWDERAGVLEVAVEEGVVRVEGSCLAEPRRLAAGASARFGCDDWVAAAEGTDAEGTEEAVIARAGSDEVVEEVVAEPMRAERIAPLPSSEVHEVVAREGAEAPMEADTLVSAASASAAEVLEAAQRASLAGDLGAAETLLRAVRIEHPNTDEAALAAFLLGRMAFDDQHAYAVAADWFRSYAEERPLGRLVREAMGRELEARERAGEVEGARELASRYLDRFPEGPHRERAARILGATE